MRLQSDEEIDSLSTEAVKKQLQKLGESGDVSDPHSFLKTKQRSRKFVEWHDHSTILRAGYILMTIHALYDPAVFLTTEEYVQKTGNECKKRCTRHC